MDAGKRILLVAQEAADLDDPQPSDLYEVGTLATILQLLKLPDGTVKVLVEGGERALINRFNVADHFSADITLLSEDDRHDEREIDVLVRSIITQFEQYVKLNKKVPPEMLTSLSGIDEPGRLADTVAAHMALKLSEKQRILEIQDVKTPPRAGVSASSRARSTYCRSRNAFVAALSNRWRRASASTT